MAHGGYGKRRVNPAGRRSKGLGVEKKPKPKPKSVSLKNQIRSIERMLRKDLPSEIQEKKLKELEQLKKQQEIHSRLAVERKIFLRDRKIKFFERRKVERRIRRLEKLQRASSGQAQDAEIAEQLSKLKEDLEYVRFFPKTEKYVSLFTGGDDSDIVDRRNKLRKQIKANLVAAAASGKDLEETGSEDDGLMDLSEDDFFLGSSSDEADADDEWTDKSTREQASSASGKAASGMSSDERNQRQISARALMPPPRPATITASSSSRSQSRFGPSSSKNKSTLRAEMSTSSNTSNGRSGSAFKSRGSSKSKSGHSSNLSSNSDAHKPRRKRRPKKKKQQA
ncbi:rRNA-processing protein EFG1 isoform X1 [Corylus avellana]|uniref:rRNA-processing protein EFG1 isoform X1 n=1 Tax=Corylus avellana TaxID=13451 RepID=UPI00286A5DC3|nr:rRNA-processing protein EFG1 isoform X1 [Corylus avellana]